MSKYGPGLSFGEVCNFEKEQIKHALRGELVCGEEDDGTFAYMLATQEECEKFILAAYDEAVYHAIEAMRAGTATENVMLRHGMKIPMPEYLSEIELLASQGTDYNFEPDEAEHEEDFTPEGYAR